MEKRNTKQKSQVRQVVLSLATHFSAEEIYRQVQIINAKISLATVYRILNEMVEQKELNVLHTIAGPALFDSTTLHHYHIVCTVCNQLEDVDMEYQNHLDQMLTTIKSAQKFTHEITFKRICTSCSQKQSSFSVT